MSIKKLFIQNANYLFEDDLQKVELSINYDLGEFVIKGDTKSDLYKEVENKARDLISRKSRVNLA